MKRLLKLLVMMIRPPVALILIIFAALGLAVGGKTEAVDPLFTTVFIIVAGWFINATVLNDLGDEPIDRVNLQNARGRPLVSGDATRSQLLALGVAAGTAAFAVAWAVSWRVGLVVTAGLVLNVAYSSRPFRLCTRGALAVVLLPLGYVALPFLVGAFSVSNHVGARGWALLAGLYVAFIGRIVLKDFRDIVGDEMYGKRTFLVRHGRRLTLITSGICWMAGSSVVLWIVPAALIPVFAGFVACALHGLRLLARETHPAQEQVLIGAIAGIGRGMCICILTLYTVVSRSWTVASQDLIVGLVALFFVGAYGAAVTERHQVPATAVRPF